MRKTLGLPTTICAVLALAACGSDDTAGSGGSGGGSGSLKGKVIKINMVNDLTGAASFAGVPSKEGAEFAIKEANESGELKGAKLEMSTEDAGTKPAQAATLTSKAVASDSVAEVFGVTSQNALAAAPVAQRGKLSMTIIQAGAPGTVETGDYVFRTTAPPILGAFVVTWLPTWLSFAGSWRPVLEGVLVLFMVVYARDGLVGIARRLTRRVDGLPLPKPSRRRTTTEA